MKKQIKFSAARFGSLVGTMVWSAHYHAGQGSQEYRMGCRARTLLGRSSEIGEFVASRCFDSFEFATLKWKRPATMNEETFEAGKKTYQRLEKISKDWIANRRKY